jgi:hypothetical protein
VPPLPPKPGAKGLLRAVNAPRTAEEKERQERHRSEVLAEECGQIEEDLEALKGRYEMFFLGIERREPSRERDEMKRRIGRIKGEFTSNTGLQFRIQTLNARYLAYERMWLRSAREKEAGTYRRDVLRARRQRERAEVAAPRPGGGEAAASTGPVAVPADGAGRGVPAPAASGSATSGAAGRPRPGTPLPQGVSEAQVRALYDAYLEAKRRCNEDVSRLSYEAVARSVAKQVPEIVAKYNARSVEFKVAIKDGRAVLKAVPKL